MQQDLLTPIKKLFPQHKNDQKIYEIKTVEIDRRVFFCNQY